MYVYRYSTGVPYCTRNSVDCIVNLRAQQIGVLHSPNGRTATSRVDYSSRLPNGIRVFIRIRGFCRMQRLFANGVYWGRNPGNGIHLLQSLNNLGVVGLIVALNVKPQRLIALNTI